MSRAEKFRRSIPSGIYYNKGFVSRSDRKETLDWLSTLYPIWEQRYSENNPPPEGETHRQLLRPVYWLGNWQFACLNYYHPPKGIHHRCVRAEPFPAVLQRMVERAEATTRKIFHGADLPKGWKLNTCLVNFYGSRLEDGKKIDIARVGEHKDFEPGPVASVSFGERALFQFVSSRTRGQRDSVAFQQWLDDSSLQIFGGSQWKSRYFHRVQRVEKKGDPLFQLNVEGFETRRVNFTFRYVPEEHIVRYKDLPSPAAQDVSGYMQLLANHSDYFRREVNCRGIKKTLR